MNKYLTKLYILSYNY